MTLQPNTKAIVRLSVCIVLIVASFIFQLDFLVLSIYIAMLFPLWVFYTVVCNSIYKDVKLLWV